MQRAHVLPYRMAGFFLFFSCVIAIILSVALGDASDLLIQKEGLACLAIATAIPGLQKLISKYCHCRNLKYSTIAHTLHYPISAPYRGILCKSKCCGTNDVDNFHYYELDLAEGKTAWNLPGNRGLINNLDALSAEFTAIAANVRRSLYTTKPFWCDFEGVTCGDLGTSTYANVVSIDLSYLQLSGVLPTSIGDFQSMVSLTMPFNQLGGPIPDSICSLGSLQQLDLGGNTFAGTVPAKLGDLKSLVGLYLYSNSLNGPIPESLGSLKSLKQLSMYSNHFTGPMPESVADLSSLVDLYLYSNSLTGTIPANIGGLKSVVNLHLNANSLHGTIPASIGSLPSLVNLILNSNSLTGSVPASLGGLKNLRQLALAVNSLTGAIPQELSHLTDVDTKELHWNFLTTGDVSSSMSPSGAPVSSLSPTIGNISR